MKKFPVLETERLLLRELTKEDAAELYNYYADREVTQYLDWFGPSSASHAEEMIEGWGRQFGEDTFLRWGIVWKETNTLIGTVPIHPVRGPFRWKLPIVLGYELSKDYWNRGIMTETLEAVIAYIFHALDNHRICAEVFPENIASLKVLEKLGFEREGYLKQHLWHDGTKTWHDVIVLAKLR